MSSCIIIAIIIHLHDLGKLFSHPPMLKWVSVHKVPQQDWISGRKREGGRYEYSSKILPHPWSLQWIFMVRMTCFTDENTELDDMPNVL